MDCIEIVGIFLFYFLICNFWSCWFFNVVVYVYMYILFEFNEVYVKIFYVVLCLYLFDIWICEFFFKKKYLKLSLIFILCIYGII